MAIALRFAARSDVGLLREGNEDSGYAGPRLLVVADGMGGHAAGEVASSVAVATLAPLDEDPPGADLVEWLASAVGQASRRLGEMVEQDPRLSGMGTTLTALLRAGGRLGLAHIGDSRAYLLRGGELSQITRDHTFVQGLVDDGRITPEEATHHPQRSVLTRVLDGEGRVAPDLSVREARLGDRYLLCSDGLSGVVSTETLRDTLAEGDPQAAVERLVELALRGGGPDNITCIVAEVVDVEAAPSATPVVAGAATDEPTLSGAVRRGAEASAAGRAAALRPPATRRGADETARTGSVDRTAPGARRRWRRRVALVGVLAALLVGTGTAGYAWSQQQYFLGADGRWVAIFRGLSQDVGPVRLSSVYERLDVRLDELPEYARQRVEATIGATGLSDARRIGGTLRDTAAGCVVAERAPTPAPTLTPPTLTPPPATPAPTPPAGCEAPA